VVERMRRRMSRAIIAGLRSFSTNVGFIFLTNLNFKINFYAVVGRKKKKKKKKKVEGTKKINCSYHHGAIRKKEQI
jgi:hypothetical protein